MSSPPTTRPSTHPMGTSRPRRRFSVRRERRQSYYDAYSSSAASLRTVRGPDDDFDEVISALTRKVYFDFPKKIIYPLEKAILILSTSSLDEARETYLEQCNKEISQEVNTSIELAKQILGRVSPIIPELREELMRNKRVEESLKRKIQEWIKRYNHFACRRRRDADEQKRKIVEEVRKIYNFHLPEKIKPSPRQRFPRARGDTNANNTHLS